MTQTIEVEQAERIEKLEARIASMEKDLERIKRSYHLRELFGVPEQTLVIKKEYGIGG